VLVFTSNVTVVWMTEVLLCRGLILNLSSDSLQTDYLKKDIPLTDSYETDCSGGQHYDWFLNTSKSWANIQKGPLENWSAAFNELD